MVYYYDHACDDKIMIINWKDEVVELKENVNMKNSEKGKREK